MSADGVMVKTCKRGLHTFTGKTCEICKKETNKKWRYNNREIINASKRDWASRNKDKISASNKRVRVKLGERILNQKAEYRKRNKEKIFLAGVKYRQENADSIRVLKASRRARKRLSGGKMSKDLIPKLMKLQRGKCTCCGGNLGKNYHIDHIIPIALGGSSNDDNLQLLTSKCNLQKKAKHPVEFMQSRGFLL